MLNLAIALEFPNLDVSWRVSKYENWIELFIKIPMPTVKLYWNSGWPTNPGNPESPRFSLPLEKYPVKPWNCNPLLKSYVRKRIFGASMFGLAVLLHSLSPSRSGGGSMTLLRGKQRTICRVASSLFLQQGTHNFKESAEWMVDRYRQKIYMW